MASNKPSFIDTPNLWEALAQLPRQPLAEFPTPLSPMRRLSRAIGGLELWLKRDDLIGFGLGGNKVRGLELLVADAMAQGAEVLVTGAAAGAKAALFLTSVA